MRALSQAEQDAWRDAFRGARRDAFRQSHEEKQWNDDDSDGFNGRKGPDRACNAVDFRRQFPAVDPP